MTMPDICRRAHFTRAPLPALRPASPRHPRQVRAAGEPPGDRRGGRRTSSPRPASGATSRTPSSSIRLRPSSCAQTSRSPASRRPSAADSFGGEAFDVIYHCDVMSHFYDPVAEFRRMRAALQTRRVADLRDRQRRRCRSEVLRALQRLPVPGSSVLLQPGERARPARAERLRARRVAPLLGPAQLRSLETLDRAKKLVARRSPAAAEANGSAPPPANGRARAVLGDVSDYANYLLRYKVGSAAPKAGRPQTFVMVARARERAD